MRNIFLLTIILLINSLSFSQDRLVNSTALANGCRIIASAPSYYVSNPHTIKIDAWTVQGLLDETATIGWCSSVYPSFPMNFVFELPEEYIFEKVVFNNKCQKEYAGICAKIVKIEVSVTGPNSGFTDAGSFTLSEYNVSEHAVNKIKGRWVKLSILSNYGNAEYTELMDFQLMGKYADPSYDASNIVGMWDTNFDWVSINSNQNGYIYGCYKWSQGELFSGKVDRRVFKFKWSQKQDGQKGWCTVVINKEGTRLSGIWGYNENYSQFGFWDFKKSSDKPYNCWNSKDMQNIKPDYVLKSDTEKKLLNE
ncbi:MAG: hypothetical protein K2X86_04625, partial [Cytophagaceae bacterium]|nr:hypothetical protein [Cytophagaceae bacterium]